MRYYPTCNLTSQPDTLSLTHTHTPLDQRKALLLTEKVEAVSQAPNPNPHNVVWWPPGDPCMHRGICTRGEGLWNCETQSSPRSCWHTCPSSPLKIEKSCFFILDCKQTLPWGRRESFPPWNVSDWHQGD